MRALDCMRNLQDPELLAIEQKQLSLFTKAEVRQAAWNEDLAQQHTARAPDAQAIPTRGVDIPRSIAAETIGYADICHGKDAAVSQELGLAALFDVVSISTLIS
jgi:hypothetical protein